MLVKIISSTNPKIEKYIGEKRIYFKLYNCACLQDLNKPMVSIQTSEIVEESREGNIITIETENSVYKLEVLEDVYENN